KQIFTINKKIKIPINQLDFRYGAVAFSYKVEKIILELEFEIENDEIRPEFDVLKPYFSKALKSRFVEVEIFAEFEKELLVSQTAISSDLEKINREIIESVKFNFIERSIIARQYLPGTEDYLLDLNQV